MRYDLLIYDSGEFEIWERDSNIEPPLFKGNVKDEDACGYLMDFIRSIAESKRSN